MTDTRIDTAPTFYPCLRYRDARAAIAWLGRAFGLRERVVYGEGDMVHHAELALGNGIVMLGSAREDALGTATPAETGGKVTGLIYVYVAEIDAHHDRAVAAGATIVRPPQDTDYGSREYGARDLEGNYWSFGTYHPAASDPAEG
ncbi:MAG: VOC family protein [Candidatus Eremiobacteraeota bacterium]|nr:VOC family protein [Candidatus Eremiobacteraeota bacterium]